MNGALRKRIQIMPCLFVKFIVDSCHNGRRSFAVRGLRADIGYKHFDGLKFLPGDFGIVKAENLTPDEFLTHTHQAMADSQALSGGKFGQKAQDGDVLVQKYREDVHQCFHLLDSADKTQKARYVHATEYVYKQMLHLVPN